MHKSDFLCVGQGHNGLFTRGTDVTLFSAIRTHKGHLGHAKQENTNFHIVVTQRKARGMMMKRKGGDALSQVIASVIGER